MDRYFAYGSNMSRSRLEERLGDVVHLGRGVLRNYEHSFTHQGKDGTGKGNIGEAVGGTVHGVVYELSPEQFEILHPYEGGYDFIKVDVTLASTDETLECCTYMDRRPPCGVPPSEAYLQHYRQGMEENDIPQAYQQSVFRQVKR